MIKNPIASEFMKRLQQAEASGDVRGLAELFTEDAELLNLTRQNTHATRTTKQHCTQTSAQFWRQYLHAFDHISSHFTNVIDDGRTAVLEWHSTGSLPMGIPVDYNGVSIIECEEGKIRRFRTYYDSAAFLPHAARSEKTHSETVGVPDITNQISS